MTFIILYDLSVASIELEYFHMQQLKSIKEVEYRKTTKSLILFFARVVLGLVLFIKGISFIHNQEFLEGLISNTAFLDNLLFLKIVISSIHILGGIFIIIGFYSRLAIIIQLPIIFAAIVLLSISGGISYIREIAFALTIFILLVSCLKFGEGLFSWKNLINSEKNIVYICFQHYLTFYFSQNDERM